MLYKILKVFLLYQEKFLISFSFPDRICINNIHVLFRLFHDHHQYISKWSLLWTLFLVFFFAFLLTCRYKRVVYPLSISRTANLSLVSLLYHLAVYNLFITLSCNSKHNVNLNGFHTNLNTMYEYYNPHVFVLLSFFNDYVSKLSLICYTKRNVCFFIEYSLESIWHRIAHTTFFYRCILVTLYHHQYQLCLSFISVSI